MARGRSPARHYRLPAWRTKASSGRASAARGARARAPSTAAPASEQQPGQPLPVGVEPKPEAEHRAAESRPARHGRSRRAHGAPSRRSARTTWRARSTAVHAEMAASSATVAARTACVWRPRSGHARCVTSAEIQAAEAEEDVALRPLRAADAHLEPEPLRPRPRVAHHERAEARDGDDQQHRAVTEEGAEADEGGELGVAVDERVDHARRAGPRCRSARDAAVEDVERAGEDDEPAREEDRAAREGEAGEHADAELRPGERVGMHAQRDEVLLERPHEAAVPERAAAAPRSGASRPARRVGHRRPRDAAQRERRWRRR